MAYIHENAITSLTEEIIEPVTLTEVKAHLRLNIEDTYEDNDILLPLITTATQYCEQYTGISIALKSLKVYMPCFPQSSFCLPHGPVTQVTNVQYKDVHSTTNTLLENEDFITDTSSTKRGVLLPLKPWPNFVPYPLNAIEISYVAGYTTQTIPKTIRQAILLLIGHWYENREAVITGAVASVKVSTTVDALLKQHKVRWF